MWLDIFCKESFFFSICYCWFGLKNNAKLKPNSVCVLCSDRRGSPVCVSVCLCVCWGGQGGQGWGSHTGDLMLAAGLCTHHDSIYQPTPHDWSQATANGPHYSFSVLQKAASVAWPSKWVFLTDATQRGIFIKDWKSLLTRLCCLKTARFGRPRWPSSSCRKPWPVVGKEQRRRSEVERSNWCFTARPERDIFFQQDASRGRG